MSQAVIDAVKALPYEINAKTNAIDKSHKLVGGEVETPTGQIFSVKLDEVQPQPSAKGGAILTLFEGRNTQRSHARRGLL